MKQMLAILLIFISSFLMGTQVQAADGKMCYDLYQPVCAAQQVECFAAPCYPQYKTYSNSCFMGNENATLIHQGECTATETGPVKPDASSTQPYVPIVKPHPAPTTHASSTISTTSLLASSTLASTSSSTSEVSHGFFYTIWHTILSWFGIS